MNCNQTIQQLSKFFSTTDKEEFVQIFGEHIGAHLWRKYERPIEDSKRSVLENGITLHTVHRFLNGLDLENEGKLNRYLEALGTQDAKHKNWV